MTKPTDFSPEVLWQWWWSLTESQRRLIYAAVGKPSAARPRNDKHADAVSNAMVYASLMTKATAKKARKE